MIGIGIGSGSGGGGSGSVSPIGASLDLIFRDPLGVEFGAPRTIAGTTTVAGWPNLGTFTRASTADWINVAGNGLETQAANNVLRRGPVRGALFEQGSTNSARNGALAGAVANVSLPTHFTPFNSGGLVTTCVGVTPQRGGPASGGWNDVAIRFQGTTSGTFAVFSFEDVSGIAASGGQTWTASLFAGVTGGSLANVSSVRTNLRFIGGAANTGETNMSLSADIVRQPAATAVGGAGVTHVAPAIVLFFASGVSVDVTITFRLIQCEQAAGALSPIITNGSPITRAADQLVVPVSLPETTWTIAGVATMPGTPNNTTENILNLSIDANTRFLIRRDTANLLAGTVSGGTPSSGPSVTAPALGARFAFCLRRNGTQLSLSINGGAPVNATPTMPAGAMTSLLVGHRSGGDGQWNSYIERMPVFPTAVSDAEMQTYSTLATWGA